MCHRGRVLRLIKPEDVRDADVLERFRASLSGDEQARISKFIFEKDRHVRLVARGSLRQALSEHAVGVPPSAFRFRYNEFGKPFIEQPDHLAGVGFNLSHCDGLIAILIADGSEVGIDVERIRPTPDLLGVAHRFFAPPEVEVLRQTPEPDRLERFFQYWTLKESYLKSRGIGLSLGLDRFWFELDPGIRIRFSDGFHDDPARWTFHQQRLDPHHLLATAVAS